MIGILQIRPYLKYSDKQVNNLINLHIKNNLQARVGHEQTYNKLLIERTNRN